ncbi:hypothetical protein CTI12_AA118520 [Artemisia annua]|uniref:Uncharacterized protein n=1 Tax=Artemisia annua TaxID=35608 RepID=A0A2U1PS93_ARTAN|nr:hypothetical protein CTI12_AA118520 [Artemisia annua]
MAKVINAYKVGFVINISDPGEDDSLSQNMAKVINAYKVGFVINISDPGEDDSLSQNECRVQLQLQLWSASGGGFISCNTLS